MPRARQHRLPVFGLSAVVLLVWTAHAAAQAPVAYRISFPERAHRLMDVEVTFADVPAGTLQIRMSRSSPGRYALHEFAKNVFDVRVTDGAGRTLPVTRSNPHQWDVTDHDATVRVAYRVFGDRVDGTYLGVDSTHAHINMPAALMWARGMERRPISVRFELPSGASWRVATQLMSGSDNSSFTAPNLQYLMDSPAEVGRFALRTFTVSDDVRTPVFRLAVHHAGSDGELDTFARDVQTIVHESRLVFREFPAFESNTYTFLADYLPWANGDGMEHRNSTVLTSQSSIAANRLGLLGTVAHEFFHAWNVERIRPKSLEPFNFEETNPSGELWMAEGFTTYYGSLILKRAGFTTVQDFAADMGRDIDQVATRPGRQVRSAVEMSQFAPFVDAATSIDRTSFDNTYVSYYTWGSAIALALDLALRDRSEGRVTLDDYMRALWERHGKPGGKAMGSVDEAYTIADLKAALARVSGDAAFANDFFARFVEGHEIADYEHLLGRAGFLLRSSQPERAFAGDLVFQDRPEGVRISTAVPFGSPAFAAGLDRDDLIVAIDGTTVTTGADVLRTLTDHKPGETVTLAFERRGTQMTATLTLARDPHRELVPVEDAGQTLTDPQRQFRDAWLSSGARNTF